MNHLVNQAELAREQAYCPYSRYAVGAAILGPNGEVWTGSNVENVSYGLTICAERTAVSKMVSDGGRQIVAVAVVTADGGTPCGMCLQTLLEFTPDPKSVEVLVSKPGGEVTRYSLADLIPHGFSSSLPSGEKL